MSWLRSNLGTLAMAVLLAVLTWMWLYSESTAPPKTLEFNFKPEIPDDLAAVSYEFRNGSQSYTVVPGGRIRLTVTGPRGVVEGLRPGFACAPAIDPALFTTSQGSITVPLRREDFPLPSGVHIQDLPVLVVTYVRYASHVVNISALPTDVEGPPAPGLRVREIRPSPGAVEVQVPASQKVPSSVGIEKVRLEGRTSTFFTPGRVRAEVPGLRQRQDFSLEVVLEKVTAVWTIKDVELSLAGPPAIVHRLQFKNRTPIRVDVEGPPEYEKEMTAKDLFVFVRTDHLTEADLKTSPIVLKDFGCTVTNPKFGDRVRVATIMSEAKPENRQAEVDVLPGK